MSCGFKRHADFRPVFAVDGEFGKPSSGQGSLQCNQTYELNIGISVRRADLALYEPTRLLEESGLRPGELDVLISCAPCTGFSRTLRKNHLEDDPRNHLIERTAEFVAALKPAVLVMENARELVRGNFSYHCDALKDKLRAIGYSFFADTHMLTSFGLPQIRERAIVLAVRDRGEIRTLDDLWDGFEVRPEALTVRSAIGKLRRVKAGATDQSDPAHVSPNFSSDITLRRLKAIPHDGGSWFDLLSHKDVGELLTPSMKRIAEKRDFGSHPDVYGRLWWDRPCVTIKRECAHVGNGRYSHPTQDRMCTVRELALMNGFPRDYVFSGTLSNMYRHVGDAVPPLISFQLAQLCSWIIGGQRPALEDCILPGTTLEPSDIRPAKGNLRLFG